MRSASQRSSRQPRKAAPRRQQRRHASATAARPHVLKQQARKFSSEVEIPEGVLLEEEAPEAPKPRSRLPKRKYIHQAAQELLADAQKAGGDIYAPADFFDVYKKATLTIPQFEDVIKHPLTSDAQKAAVISGIFTQLKATKPTIDFFTQLAQDNKLNLAKDVLELFRKDASVVNKDTLATVISAEPLTAAQLKTVTKNLEPLATEGTKLRVANKIDANILGGLIIQMDEFYQDLSFSSGYRVIEQKVHDATAV